MLKPDEIEMPARIERLPRDRRGYPVPWFVAWVDGEPDFRVLKEDAIVDALRFDTCWICGGALGRHRTYVIGPMGAVNRVSAEPPSHRECAEYSARVCPFLTIPHMHRVEGNYPEGAEEPAGVMIKRNPGVALLWCIEGKTRFFEAPNGILFDVGTPSSVLWYAEGREATRDEVMASIESGYPTLLEMAESEGDRAVRHLEKQRDAAMELIPA